MGFSSTARAAAFRKLWNSFWKKRAWARLKWARGLVPKQEDSGESQPQLGISKAGDTMVRKLLVGSAQYILGPFGPDTDLRRYGLRLCERGGKNAKKRAAVAVARKLAVLLHCLWVSGEVYEPLRQGLSPTLSPAVAA